MTALLTYQGFEVHGFSNQVRPNSLFKIAHLSGLMSSEEFGDVRDFQRLQNAIAKSKAELVIHFAAQPIVLESYKNAKDTFEVNINGTLNTLEASLDAGCERVLIITTDKVYKDLGLRRGYSEQDPLQGWDPYAASKAAADIVTQSWLELHRDEMRVDVARGGNVIGGGDDSEFRLVPDIEKSIASGNPVQLRNPHQVRPWQHVLDCLDGYLKIVSSASGSLNTWNVGPSVGDPVRTTAEFASLYLEARGVNLGIVESVSFQKETAFLRLDSEQIHKELAWSPKWESLKAIRITGDWHRRVQFGENALTVTLSQIEEHSSANT